MESACVYEPKTVVNELSQGIQMAKQLRVHLNSAEAREFLIQKILSSYENALYLLTSGESAGLTQAATMPTVTPADSPVSIGSGEFEFKEMVFNQQDQNVVSKKRKVLTTLEDQAETSNKRKQTCDHGAQSVSPPPPPPPPSPEKYEIKPTHHNQLSPPHSGETLSDFRANLSVNTTVPSLLSFPSFRFMGDDYQQQLHFPDYLDDDLLQVHSPSFISPNTSESNYFTEWGSSPSLDFSNGPEDVDLDFTFDNYLF